MAKTLQQILGAKNLTGVIQGVKDGLDPGWLPESFLQPTRTVQGNHCTYLKVAGTRQTARLVHYGSPSVRRSLSGISEVPITLLHTLEHIHHDASVLMNLMDGDNADRQQFGISEITRQTREFKRVFTNLRIATVLSVLASGKIHFDGDGNLLPDDSGAAISIDMGIPETNKDNLDGIIAASWATTGTQIHKHIAALKEAAIKKTGYPIRHAFYGANALDYFLKNTYLKELIHGNDEYQTVAAGGEIPQGFLGLQWHPVYEAFYHDADGSNQSFFDDDMVVFTPEPSADWWEMIEGTYATPGSVGQISDDALGVAGQLSQAAGMFSYAVVETDPTAVKQIAGDTFLPVLKVPAAVYVADMKG